VKENGRIVSLLGIYPLPAVIAGEKVLMGTIGNIASLPAARGRGYMKQLVTVAIEEAMKQGFVAARLDGLRSRYNRYDFDHAGVNYVCCLTQRNRVKNPKAIQLNFEQILVDDHDAIAFAKKCHRNSKFYVLRETDKDFFYTLRAWKNIPYIAKNKQGMPVGYISVSPDGKNIAEWGVDTGYTVIDLLSAYLQNYPKIKEVTFLVMPYDTDQIKAVFVQCESWHAKPASMFHVFQWDRFVYVLMKLAAQTKGLVDGELTVAINNWGNLHMTVKNGVPKAKKCEHNVEVYMMAREAVNWFFGNLRAIQPIPGTRAEASWFPLPLCWNGQDRV
jgi:hypothetical protein